MHSGLENVRCLRVTPSRSISHTRFFFVGCRSPSLCVLRAIREDDIRTGAILVILEENFIGHSTRDVKSLLALGMAALDAGPVLFVAMTTYLHMHVKSKVIRDSHSSCICIGETNASKKKNRKKKQKAGRKERARAGVTSENVPEPTAASLLADNQ